MDEALEFLASQKWTKEEFTLLNNCSQFEEVTLPESLHEALGAGFGFQDMRAEEIQEEEEEDNEEEGSEEEDENLEEEKNVELESEDQMKIKKRLIRVTVSIINVYYNHGVDISIGAKPIKKWRKQ